MFVLVAHQFVLGGMPSAFAVELTTLVTSKARTQMIIFTFVVFIADKQLGKGMLWSKTEATTNERGHGHGFWGSQAEVHKVAEGGRPERVAETLHLSGPIVADSDADQMSQ